MQKASLTQEALLALGVTEPKVFAAWSFYDHHMQYTPMAFGPEAVFDSSAYYKVCSTVGMTKVGRYNFLLPHKLMRQNATSYVCLDVVTIPSGQYNTVQTL